MDTDVAAIVLAAGQSRRMGTPKMVLPWGGSTVIGTVVRVLQEAGLRDVLVITGGAEAELNRVLSGTAARLVHNEGYRLGGMISSVQTGLLAAMPGTAQAAMIALGDQPQIQVEVVRMLLDRWRVQPSPVLLPSYQMRRGHPWLLRRDLWPAVLALGQDETLRDFLQRHTDSITYLPVDTPSVLQDLDTPEDYAVFRPDSG